jgi:hypothetical protein
MAPEAEKEKQGALTPCPDHPRSDCHREHQEVDIEDSLSDTMPSIFRGIPTPAEIGCKIKGRGPFPVMEEKFRDEAQPSEDETTCRQNGHQAPFFVVFLFYVSEG